MKITFWLANEFLSRPIFRQLSGFKGMFHGLIVLHGDQSTCDPDAIEIIKLIESLALVDVATDDMPEFALAGVAARTTFRTSSLYTSFVEAKVNHVLTTAKSATGEARLALVNSCKDLPNLPAGMRDTITMVTTLFDERLPLKTRVEYLTNSELKGTENLARQWDPNGIMGIAAVCISETADLTDVAYDLFEQIARILIDIDMRVKNPVVSAAVQFYTWSCQIQHPCSRGSVVSRLARWRRAWGSTPILWMG
jgi:hypothetical protein